jgi:hypothetical protein
MVVTSVIPALGRLRQRILRSIFRLGYKVRPCLKQNNPKRLSNLTTVTKLDLQVIFLTA